MAPRAPIVLGADGFAQQLQSADVLIPSRLTVAQLNALTNLTVGAIAFATNGRAITGTATVTGTFTTQAAGSGSGCLVTCASSSSTASTWVLAGTTQALAA